MMGLKLRATPRDVDEDVEMAPLVSVSNNGITNGSDARRQQRAKTTTTSSALLHWLLPRLLFSCLLGTFLYHIPGLFLEVAFFPARGVMMPNTIQGVQVPPTVVPKSTNETRFPKRIHVTYKSIEQLPPAWKDSLEEWKRLHPTWEVKFWADDDIYAFVKEHYPQYQELFQSYPYMIQRVDSVRYMILLKYGGIYSDLDIYPAQNLDGLVSYFFEQDDKDVVLAKTLNAGLTNAYMMAVDNSDFMQCVVEALPYFKDRFYHIIHWRHWKVLSSAGSTFLWSMLGHCGKPGNKVAVLDTASFRKCSVCDTWLTNVQPTADWCDTPYFKHTSENSSWHQTDSLFHKLWFTFTMSLFCKPFQACMLLSFGIVVLLLRSRRS